jgi:cytochrome P450
MSNELGLGDFDAAKTPIFGSVLFGEVNLALCDANVIQEIFTTKNDCVDKSGTQHLVLKPLLGDAILFSKADEAWKAKRKAISHAFYRDRMVFMLDVLKEALNKRF